MINHGEPSPQNTINHGEALRMTGGLSNAPSSRNGHMGPGGGTSLQVFSRQFEDGVVGAIGIIAMQIGLWTSQVSLN